MTTVMRPATRFLPWALVGGGGGYVIGFSRFGARCASDGFELICYEAQVPLIGLVTVASGLVVGLVAALVGPHLVALLVPFRWIGLSLAGVVVLGLVVDSILNRPSATLEERSGHRIWMVAQAEGVKLELPGEVRPDDALICLGGAHLKRLDDISDSEGYRIHQQVWLEGERVENPPEGGAGPLFERDPIGTVWVHCGEEQPHST